MRDAPLQESSQKFGNLFERRTLRW
jgi:hypothetical protein